MKTESPLGPRLEAAVSRFEEAGLPLPAVSVSFHATSDGCHGYLGYYDEAARQLDMCNWGQHYKITPASTLLHELAHAWSFEHMTHEDRIAFAEFRELDNWNQHNSWWHMGQEQAAEIIAWGVSDGAFQSPYIEDADCATLTSAYSLMSGTTPISPNSATCPSTSLGRQSTPLPA